jgi:hypothetical protein
MADLSKISISGETTALTINYPDSTKVDDRQDAHPVEVKGICYYSCGGCVISQLF